ncbi:hypothetical protein [Thauera sp.]|uniref:hypothetical protein n=1 Tax=Thauera sp. TaxID=1905334 RepID=UPI0039E6C54A
MSASVELTIFQALKSAGVDDEKATAAAEAVTKAIDQRFSLHAEQLFTKRDGAELKADMIKAIAEMQRWTLGAIFAGMAAVAAIIKLVP